MPEIVDPRTGKVINVSQRVVDEKAKTYAAELADTTKSAASSISTQNLDATASDAQTAFKDAQSSIGGQVAGQVSGGMENLTSKVDGYKNELTDAKDTVTGLLSGDTTSLENMGTDMINNAISNITGKLGTKISIQYSEPDSVTGIVVPIVASLEADNSSSTISGLLSIITGLGAKFPPSVTSLQDLATDAVSEVTDNLADNFKGDLQKIVGDVSPSGLISAGKNAVGKIGAFDAVSINGLATESISQVTGQIKSTVNNALASFPNGNKEVKTFNVDNISPGLSLLDPDDAHTLLNNPAVFPGTLENIYDNVAPDTKNMLRDPDGSENVYTDSAEFDVAMLNFDSSTSEDISNLIPSSKEIKESVSGTEKELSVLSGGKDGAQVKEAIENSSAKRDAYAASVQEYQGIVKNKISNGSKVGVIQGLSTKTLTTVKQKVKEAAPKLSEDQINDVIALSQGDANDKSNAIKILADNSDLSFSEIKRFLDSIDTTIANATKLSLDKSVFSEPYEIGSYVKEWKKGEGNPIFPYISSIEELSAEVNIVPRTIERIVVHWTETHTNKNIGSEEINGWHLSAGLAGIGYHYVIRRDGSLQRGRPVSVQGQHTPDYDLNSLGIVFVGGINAPIGTPNSENFLSAQSLTRSQLNTFDHFCRSFYEFFPGIKISGHNELDITGLNVDPGFDVSDYVLTRFGKIQND